ncbi:GlxA family transcriptional regulator [Rhodohalobacter mucosus]|uniref:AraC family transcriptional regulator n=1 Tax=Rhodohalobacter mucosus TaxID=2079485 RepID=A0A316TV86_9BACT|nr:helix-turn-helix domain-containing protein [Rhodohalobacter mucosus]PWN06314.1 AraC family transcriptional regulator [Rhodohalobacter mucosus]
METIDVTVIFLEGGTPSTAVTPVEILGSAGYLYQTLQGLEGERMFDVKTASLSGKRVQTLSALSLYPDGSIDEIQAADLLVVSAGGGDLDVECRRNQGLPSFLRRAYDHGTAIAGICSGVVQLAEAGILDGRPATTHWALSDDCRERYPEVDWQPERYVTESDGVFCSGGVYSGVDLCLYLIEKYCGHQSAMKTAKALLVRTPRVWQAGYSPETPKIHHDDKQIRSLQEWLFKHFSRPITVNKLAERACMSPRTFMRRFKKATGVTPIVYVQRVRINAARHLLENDLKSVRQVCLEVGYEDIGFFRKLFRRITGLNPSDYRKRFSVNLSEHVRYGERVHHH